ncbi:MAG: AMP-binding protein [Clostridia bacterium]|nr:AMP-binding protein [Clostridia bacterium]
MKPYKKPLYDVKKIYTIKDILENSKKEFPDSTAFLTKVAGQYMPITFNQYYDDCMALGTALVNMGLKDKRIAVIGESRYEWVLTYMTVVCGAGVIVPLDREMPADEIAPLIELAELEAIVYSPKSAAIAEASEIKHKFNMETDIPALIKEGRELIEKGDTSFMDIKPDPDVLSILLFTSGTTTSSKAVMLSQKNIVSNVMGMCQMVYVDENDTLLSVLPLHHTYECTCGFLAPVYRGCTVAFCEGLRHISKNLQECHATIMLCVPLLAENMYKRIWQSAKKKGKEADLKKGIKLSNFLLKLHIDVRKKLFSDVHESLGGKLTRVVSGAAAIDPEIAKGLRDLGIVLIQGYGLTECSPICTVNRFNQYKDDAAGLPMPGVKVSIDSPSEDGVGEIVVSGDNVMLGYYKNEPATRAVLENGVFKTGDLGFLDDDGFLHITGRQKNVIVTKNGKNIFPEELETYLSRSPLVSECMVYGIDTEDNDMIIAVQVLPDMTELEKLLGKQPESSEIQSLIEEEVEKVNHNMQHFKRISRVIIRRDEFAKTTTKKIKRHVELSKGDALSQ